MIKSQFRTLGSPNQPVGRTFKLAIHDIHMINQASSKQHFIIIGSQKSGKSWVSPSFYRKLPDIWEIYVDYPSLIVQLFQKGNKSSQCLAKTTIHESINISYFCEISNAQNKICAINYRFYEKMNEDQPNKKNYFQSNSNIFDSFLNPNDISRVQQKQAPRYKTIQPSFERVAFHGNNDFSIMTQYDSKNVIQKRNFQKNSKKQPSKQQIKKVDESFENFDDQKHRFQGYLNDSTSFIEQLIKNMPEDQGISNTGADDNLPKVNEENNESQEQYTTAQRWYTDKYRKKSQVKKIHFTPQNLSPLPTNNDKNMIKTTVISNDFFDKDEVLRQLSDLSTDETILSKQLDISILLNGSAQKICILSRNDQLYTNQWNTAVTLPKSGTLLIKCHSKLGQLNGCIGSQQVKKGFCFLFDDQGNNHGNFHFKCKSVCNFVVQTFDIIVQNRTEVEGENSIQKQLIASSNNKGMQHEEKINPQVKEHIQQQHTTQKINELIKVQDIAPRGQPENDQNQVKKQKQEQEQDQRKKQEQRQRQRQEEKQIEQQYKKQQGLKRQKEQEVEGKEQQERQRRQYQQKQKRQQQQQRLNIQLQKRERIKSNIKRMQMKKYESITLTIQPTKSLTQSHDIGTVHGGSLSLQANLNNEHNTDFIAKDKYNTQSLANRQSSIYRGDDSPILIRNAGTAITGSLAQQQLREQLYKIPSLTLQHNQGKDDSIIDRHLYARLNETQTPKYSAPHKGKLINLKIASIDLNLHYPNHKGKILKMQIDNNVYYTETSKQLYFLTWKGKGYFFPNTPKNSIFHLELLQQRQGMQYSMGTCKIYLRVFNTDELNKIVSYEDYIRNQNQQSIGRVIINYQNLQKRGRSLESNISVELREEAQTSRLSRNARLQIDGATHMSTKKKKAKQNSLRMSTQSSKAQQFVSYRKDSRRIITNLGRNQFNLNDSIFSRLKSKPPLTKRKYTGGNVVIPKANRFRGQNMLIDGDPGPGSYEIESSFDRHASPL